MLDSAIGTTERKSLKNAKCYSVFFIVKLALYIKTLTPLVEDAHGINLVRRVMGL